MKQESNRKPHRFTQGNQCAVGHGRKPGKTVDVRLREVLPKALNKVIDEAEHGSFEASAVLVSRFGERLA